LTSVPSAKFAWQVGPQLIPDGELVTVPEPLPGLLTFSWNWLTRSKVAVTFFAAVILTSHSFEPTTSSQPDQTTALEPPAGVPVSLTSVPELNRDSQPAPLPQLIPAGLLGAGPDPVPFLGPFSRDCGGPPPSASTECETGSGLP